MKSLRHEVKALEAQTRQVRDAGGKILAPYITGGITENWTDYLHASEQAGADLIEIGLPFSDPTLDGPTVQRASEKALRRGATVERILRDVAGLGLSVPLVVMTYANLVFRNGAEEFCRALCESGITGLIVPDLPVDEAGSLSEVADRHGIDLVLLASPVTPPQRQQVIVERSRGFVYAVSLMGTTGEQLELAGSGRELATSLRRRTDLPVLAGFGVSSPHHAAKAARYADGVVVGSALMRKVLDGAGPEQLGASVASLRAALDAADG
ncbi:tryptophan synthase subunit alpha [Saccharopolyspora pogona]|uniref:tryptophan synthase subunit alpha n=1 Tax=Saccharopolyspora pogona TaxID=333966 RepID=UPI00168299F3|nr:tryptophan synthase subunit alpha [Saccharopolyspora pogona]